MSNNEKPSISINQAKILYKLTNEAKSSIGVGDFGTDDESFESVADAVDDLIRNGYMTGGNWHLESRSGKKRRDIIPKCYVTDKGFVEMDKVTDAFLHSKGNFDPEVWSGDHN